MGGATLCLVALGAIRKWVEQAMQEQAKKQHCSIDSRSVPALRCWPDFPG